MRAELLALLAASWAQEAFGVWKLNPARSTPVGNQRCITPGIGPYIRGEVFTLDTVTLMLARQHPTRSRTPKARPWTSMTPAIRGPVFRLSEPRLVIEKQ